jgi:hypothetical protein
MLPGLVAKAGSELRLGQEGHLDLPQVNRRPLRPRPRPCRDPWIGASARRAAPAGRWWTGPPSPRPSPRRARRCRRSEAGDRMLLSGCEPILPRPNRGLCP